MAGVTASTDFRQWITKRIVVGGKGGKTQKEEVNTRIM
jgi:hypothetical protein